MICAFCAKQTPRLPPKPGLGSTNLWQCAIWRSHISRQRKRTRQATARVVYAKADAFRLAMESVAGNSRVVSPNVLAPLLSGVTHRFNVLAGFAEPATSQKATGITNASHYENYTVDRICDGDDSTYFWSHGAMWQAASGTTGYVGLDFGEIVRVRNLYIATGEEGTDVFTNAAIEYSADRQSWTELCAGQFGEEIFLEGLDFDARYVRMRNTDTQSNAG